jgi:DNA-binding transcriptional ArsR family regulator
VFGVSARAEILLNFVAHPDVRATAADLADAVHYSKRNVEKELEAFRKAGVLKAERRRNRLEHFVARPDSLRLFAAPLPALFPRWDAIFEVLGALLEHDSRPASVDHEVAAIEARRFVREIADAVRRGGLPTPPAEIAGREATVALAQWGRRIGQALARGDATSLSWLPVQ